MFAYELTIENLYKYADIVLIGTYDSNGKVYTNGINIYTETNFNVDKVIKNTISLNIGQKVTFNRNGGTLTLDKYMQNNQTIKEGEFENIAEENRKDYYIIQEYGPENILYFERKNDNSDIYISYF